MFKELIIHFSYTATILLSIFGVVVVLGIPKWRKNQQKRSLMYYLLLSFVLSVLLMTYDIFIAPPPRGICHFDALVCELFLGTFMYNYVVTVITGKSISRSEWTVLLSIAFIFMIINICCLFFLQVNLHSYNYFRDFIEKENHLYVTFVFLMLLTIISEIIYITIKSLKYHCNYTNDIANDYSYTNGITMQWVIYLLILFSLVILLSSIMLGFFSTYDEFIVANIGILIVQTTIIIFGFRQESVYSNMNQPIHFVMEHSLRRQANVDKLHLAFEKLMEEQRLWSDPKLNVETIIDLLATNKVYITMMIREKYGTNFRTVINHFRIEEAKRLLLDVDNYYMVGEVCLKSGFGSESTFFRVFKENVGVTPADYQLNKPLSGF